LPAMTPDPPPDTPNVAVPSTAMQPTLDEGVADDARALKRALSVQVVGYALKAGLPFLLAFATRSYGVAAWGVFVALQALVLMAVRFGLFGLDKATLWWVGAHDPRHMNRALIPVALLAGALSTATAAVLAIGGRFILQRWDGASIDQLPALWITLLGLPLMAVTEVLLNASMGQRKMGTQVAIRDTMVPALWLTSALLFHALGLEQTGLCWAFVLSHGAGLIAAFVLVVRADHKREQTPLLRPPPELLRYAFPVWLNEIANTTLLRVDTLILVALTDPFTVGVWGVMTQFANAMRSIRRAFDPILVAVTARISQTRDTDRLAHALSYATQLVSLTQLPVFVFLLLFAGQLLPLYGDGFERGATALAVLCGFWLVSGSISLPGVVLAGYGYARLGLTVTLIGIAAEVPLLFLLVPRYGLTGAAAAVGTANLIQQFVQLGLLRQRIGAWPYNERARRSLAPTLGAAAATALAGLFLTQAGASEWVTSVGAFVSFLCVYGAIVGTQWRRGLLRAPGHTA
jgi:O-antigen/teichoic acid export membrane protein